MALALDEILKEPQEVTTDTKEEVKEEVKEVVKEEVSTTETPEVERTESTRKKHLEREYEAQGRDPKTGQFVSKEATTVAKEETKEVKAEVKQEVKVEPKVEVKAEPKKEELTEREKGLLAEADRQRRRAQELEARFAQQQPKKEEETKTFWDDPEAALKRHESQIQQALLNTKLNTAEAIARGKYADFDEKVAVFKGLVQQTPGLIPQWLASPDPAEYAYKLGKSHKELQEAGSLDKLRADIESKARADERAKVEAEFKAKLEAAEKARKEIPGTLSDVRGAAPHNRPVFTGPTPLEAILRGK